MKSFDEMVGLMQFDSRLGRRGFLFRMSADGPHTDGPPKPASDSPPRHSIKYFLATAAATTTPTVAAKMWKRSIHVQGAMEMQQQQQR